MNGPVVVATTMDYKGQQLSELLFYYITIIFGSIGWIVGYWYQDFSYVFYPWLVGVVLSTLVSDEKPLWCSTDRYKYLHVFRVFYDSHPFGFLVPLDLFQLCVPDWPFYNRHPIQWIDSISERRRQRAKKSS